MSEQPYAYIYTLSDPRSGEVRYVGKTFDLNHRYQGHLYENQHDKKCRWVKGLRFQGLKPVMEILEEVHETDDSVWSEKERFWIETLKFYGVRLLNLSSGGLGGRRHSPETRVKLTFVNVGRKHTLEARANMSRASLGKKKSQQHVANIIKGHKGLKRTEESKLKMRLSHLGKTMPEEQKEKIRMALIGKKRPSEIGQKISATKQLFYKLKRESKLCASINNEQV